MRSLMRRFNCYIKPLFNLNHSKFVGKRFLSHFTNILNSNLNSNSEFILVSGFVDGYGPLDHRLSLLTYDLNTNYSSAHDIDFPYSKTFAINGHSLGIVCLSRPIYEICLYNLITDKLHKLPPSILLHNIHETEISSQTCVVGFGYDSKSKDFKVVRIMRFYVGEAYPNPNRVEVYNLSTNRWRVIETTVVSNVLWDPSFQMYHRGVYYWWALHKTNEILSFDLSKEIFGRIQVPEIFGAWPINNRTMGVWNGSIVLFHYSSIDQKQKLAKSFDIWAMEKDESGVVSWRKISTIGPLPGVKKPLFFVNSDILLMESVESGEDEQKEEAQLIAYNIKTKELNYLPVKGRPDYIEGCIFAKSLSSIKAREKVDIKIS